jgi:hypothetical protein
LSQNEREAYEVIVEEGKLMYKKSEALVNTTEGSKWIFVLSTTRSLYVGQVRHCIFLYLLYIYSIPIILTLFIHLLSFFLIFEQKKKGSFQHSSFLSGAATTAAGRLVAKEGVLEVILILACKY